MPANSHGKGSTPRPRKVSHGVYSMRWQLAFSRVWYWRLARVIMGIV
jgi:hypothetical protein